MEIMHYYKISLKLNGNTLNEVPKIATTPELLILQYIHGMDAICRVEEIKNETVDQFEEKKRLRDIYDVALMRKEQSVDKIFGAFGLLPERLPAELIKKFDIFDDPLSEYNPADMSGPDLNAMKNKKRASARQGGTQEAADNESRIIPEEEVNTGDLME